MIKWFVLWFVHDQPEFIFNWVRLSGCLGGKVREALGEVYRGGGLVGRERECVMLVQIPALLTESYMICPSYFELELPTCDKDCYAGGSVCPVSPSLIHVHTFSALLGVLEGWSCGPHAGEAMAGQLREEERHCRMSPTPFPSCGVLAVAALLYGLNSCLRVP